MELPARNASFLPTIKCSNCGRDIEMAAMAEHQCMAALPVPTMAPSLPRTDSASSLRNMRPQRPLLPKIDPNAPIRPQAFHGELTPASSGHNSMVSPVSATSGPRSPWPAVRKASLPGPRRPPSLELSNLDCAFPPFPMPTRSATTRSSRRRERSATHRSDTKRSRSRDAPKAAPQASGPPPPIPSELPTPSENHGGDQQNSKELVAYNPSGSKESSLGAASKPGADGLPEVQITAVEARLPIQPPFAGLPVPRPATNSPIPSNRNEGQVFKPTGIDSGFGAFDFGVPRSDRPMPSSAPSEPIPSEPRAEDRSRADTEPSYKSKRPPPLLSNDEITPLVKSPTTPQPSSGGSLSKGLGRLFSRRRSQSATIGRDVARQALSDEPDFYETPSPGPAILSPALNQTFFTAEPSPLSPSPLASPEPLTPHEESLKALEGLIPEPQTSTTPPLPVVVVEPVAEEGDLPTSMSTSTLDLESIEEAVTTTSSEDVAIPQDSQLIEDLRRVSLDSASSYGSGRFSEEHTVSTRSSSRQTDSLAPKSQASSQTTLLNIADVEMPAPLRPRMPEASTDSPTDPLFQQGHLSPIPDLPNGRKNSTGSLSSNPSDSEMPPTPTPAPDAALPNDAPKTTGLNKGICRGCSQVILATQKSVSSADGRLTGRYHKECFACQTCKSAFPTAEFYVHNDQPYCAYHYHELEDSLCATCGKGIEGLYMETANVAGRGKEKHHPECLKCTTCRVRLDHDYFELSGKVYCERDAFRQATLPRSHDNAPSRPSPLVREYISSGDPGLIQGRNFPERRTTRLMNMI